VAFENRESDHYIRYFHVMIDIKVYRTCITFDVHSQRQSYSPLFNVYIEGFKCASYMCNKGQFNTENKKT
jgi:hypothetical protein